jgi:hypothetical protein
MVSQDECRASRLTSHTLWQDVTPEALYSLQRRLHYRARPLAAHDELLHADGTIPGHFCYTRRVRVAGATQDKAQRCHARLPHPRCRGLAQHRLRCVEYGDGVQGQHGLREQGVLDLVGAGEILLVDRGLAVLVHRQMCCGEARAGERDCRLRILLGQGSRGGFETPGFADQGRPEFLGGQRQKRRLPLGERQGGTLREPNELFTRPLQPSGINLSPLLRGPIR